MINIQIPALRSAGLLEGDEIRLVDIREQGHGGRMRVRRHEDLLIGVTDELLLLVSYVVSCVL